MDNTLRKSRGEQIYLLDLYRNVFADLCELYPTEVRHLRRDLETIESRVALEGVSFLTKTLPKLGKAIDESLETGRLVVPREFKRSHSNNNIPALLQGLVCRLYTSSGFLDEHFPRGVLRTVREICYLAYKLELPYTQAQKDAVTRSFVDTEKELASTSIPLGNDISIIAKGQVHAVVSDFDPKQIQPRHGPGAVATGESLDEKWLFKRLYDDIHQVFPYYEYFVAGGASELHDRKEWYFALDRIKSGTAKVVLVPKDSRGPRLISAEPLEYQYIQQGLGRALVSWIQDRKECPAFGQINFRDQEVNRKLAIESSTHRYFATLDLKDASDRVRLDLVEYLFSNNESMRRALLASRTSATKLPDGRIIQLSKFAPMGSALCFPIEALCFWALSVAACMKAGMSARESQTSVYVYGDDLIVPSTYVSEVVAALEMFGLKVNMSKSFHRGAFRESCGMDAYDGIEVTPVRVRKVFTGKPGDASAFAAYVAYANELAARGYVKTAGALWRLVERTYGKVPYGTPTSGFPCRHHHSALSAFRENVKLFRGRRTRINRRTQHLEVFTKFVRAKRIERELEGWPRLLSALLTPGDEYPSTVVRPKSTQIRLGWCRV